MQIPDMTCDLLNLLNEMYPARCLAKNEDLSSHLRYAGKRDLIDYLIKEFTSNDD